MAPAQSKLAEQGTDLGLERLRAVLAAGVPRPLRIAGWSAATIGVVALIVRSLRKRSDDNESGLQRGSMFVIRLQRILRILIPGYATKVPATLTLSLSRRDILADTHSLPRSRSCRSSST